LAQIPRSAPQIENHVAPAITSVIGAGGIPREDTREFEALRMFIALQMVRTKVAADRAVQSLERVKRELEQKYGELSGKLREQLTHSEGEAARISTSNFPFVYQHLIGLRAKLVVNQATPRFVTSDNPTCKYNKYYEAVKGIGVLGAANKGIIVLTPLSPRHSLILYDNEVYKCGDRNDSRIHVSDVETINDVNGLQVVNTEGTLLFSDWTDRESVIQTCRRYKRRRLKERTVVQFLVPRSNRDAGPIVHTYEVMPNVDFRLPFLSILRKARGAAKVDASNRFRASTGLNYSPPVGAPHIDYVVEGKQPRKRNRSR